MILLLRRGLRAAFLLAAAALAASAQAADALPQSFARIGHVVVLYAENHSFDNLFGLFPGADGIANATPEQKLQRALDGTVLPELSLTDANGRPDPSLPVLPNAPFRIDAPPVSRTMAELVPDPAHEFFDHQRQIDGGRNDLFAAFSGIGGWPMGYYDGSRLRLWQWAREYTLADHFFMGAFGGSFLNHQYLVCACAPRFADAPASMASRVTPDGYAVDTVEPAYQPSGILPAAGGPDTLANPAGATAFGLPLPPQTARTIGDTLSAKGISWAWYAAGWNAAVADGMQPRAARRTVIYRRGPGSPYFQAHHQPFNYYARFAPGTRDRAEHLKDGEDFLRAIAAGTLPAVSFYKPSGVDNQHPGYSALEAGDILLDDLLRRLRASPQWHDMLVIVTYDENGGYWDHVPPPAGPGWGDRFGPGTRIPALLVGPMVKRGFVDATTYDTASILKFLTERFGLEPLPGVRPRMGDFRNALQP